MQALVDGDIVAFRSVASKDPLTEQEVEQRVDFSMQQILSQANADTFRTFLTGKGNFRKKVNPEYKAKYLNGFSKREFKTLITKTSIASFGMNYQNCNEMIFMSYDFKFEAFYQAHVKREALKAAENSKNAVVSGLWSNSNYDDNKNTRHGNMIVGQALSGKSSCWKIL